MSNVHTWPFNPGDYLADTSHLTLEESGAYLRLLCHYCQYNDLPTDGRRLAQLCGITVGRWARLSEMVLPLFQGAPSAADKVLGKTKRKAIASATRSMVYDQWDGACVYCGDETGPFEIDHANPVALGGSEDIGNLVVACRNCNRAKGATPLDVWLGVMQ